MYLIESIIIIILITIAMQILSFIYSAISYYINHYMLVKSVSAKKIKAVGVFLTILYILISITCLGGVYEGIKHLPSLIGIDESLVNTIVKSPRDLTKINTTYIYIPVIVMILEIVKNIVDYVIEKKKINAAIILPIIYTFLFMYWSFILPTGISVYWITRSIISFAKKQILNKLYGVCDKIIQKQLFKNPEKYRKFIEQKQLEKAEKMKNEWG